jgi:hypothetical protein
MKQMHKNIPNLYKKESQIGEKQESFIRSQNHKKKDTLKTPVELKLLKSVEMCEELTDSLMKRVPAELLINKISHILHTSRPLHLNYSKPILDEAHETINTQTEQHKVLVEDACKRLQDLNDEKLTLKIALFLADKEETQKILEGVKPNVTDEEFSKIRSFLEIQHALMKNENYQYELLFMYHGAITIVIEKYVEFKSKKYFTEFAHTYAYILEKSYQKYIKIQLDSLLMVQDQRTKIKIKCFQDNRNLYYEPQYKYEMMFMTIGLIYGAGDLLKQLVN